MYLYFYMVLLTSK